MKQISEVKQYVDENSHKITAYVDISSEIGAAPTIYEGVVGINTPQGIMPFDFNFPSKYATLQECFDHFEETAKAAFDKLVEERQDKNRIITPGQANIKAPDIKLM